MDENRRHCIGLKTYIEHVAASFSTKRSEVQIYSPVTRNYYVVATPLIYRVVVWEVW